LWALALTTNGFCDRAWFWFWFRFWFILVLVTVYDKTDINKYLAWPLAGANTIFIFFSSARTHARRDSPWAHALYSIPVPVPAPLFALLWALAGARQSGRRTSVFGGRWAMYI
jgi:hypothetical protein